MDIFFLAISLTTFFIIYFTIYKQNYAWIKTLYMSVFCIHFFSFLYTIFANPGIPERKYYSRNYIQNVKREEKKKYFHCKICNIITPKELNVVHCYYCDVCVINHDNHCSCFGKCVGQNNCCSFYTTIVSIPIYLVVAFITLIGYAIYIDELQISLRRQGKRP